jgi:hypothetical protein
MEVVILFSNDNSYLVRKGKTLLVKNNENGKYEQISDSKQINDSGIMNV